MRLNRVLYGIFWLAFILCIIAMVLLAALTWGARGFLMVHPYTAAFLELCGACAAFIMWQAKGVLRNLAKGLAFVESNAVYVGRSAYACFVIAASAFFRMLTHLFFGKDWTLVLIEYNTLFIPIFIVAGLLCLVLSNLFSSAAGMKQDNDLVI